MVRSVVVLVIRTRTVLRVRTVHLGRVVADVGNDLRAGLACRQEDFAVRRGHFQPVFVGRLR